MNPILRVPLRLLFPLSCLLCQEDIPEGESFSRDIPLCFACRSKISISVKTDWFPSDSLRAIVSITSFKGTVRELIHKFKYGGKDYLAKFAGTLMVPHLPASCIEIDCLAAVPMPFWREIQRGYNQAHLLACEIGAKLQKPVLRQTLRRKLWSRSQTGLSKGDRQKNAILSFRSAFNMKRVKGKKVLLIDDVTTTGSTLEQCAFLLKAAGAAQVTAVVLAKDDLE